MEDAHGITKWQSPKKTDGSEFGYAQDQKMGKVHFQSPNQNFEPYTNQAIRLKQLININPNFCEL